MRWQKGFILVFIFMLTGCINAENYTMLYEICYQQGKITYYSMYEEEDYNTYNPDGKQLQTKDTASEGEEVNSVSVYLKPAEQKTDSTTYKAVGKSGNFIMECQYADGTIKSYEYESELHSEDGTQIVLRSEWLEETGSMLVFIEEWNSHFYTAYIDGYLVQTEAYRIDINNGEILWKIKGDSNELMLTAGTTQEGETLYLYKKGAIYRLTGEQFKQVDKLGEFNIRDTGKQETLLFDLREKTIRVYYDDTPETIEFEFERN